MPNSRLVVFARLLVFHLTVISCLAQGVQPYPLAITDRVMRKETPMLPPPVNKVFIDPDFGSLMVRVTDQKTNFAHPGGYFRNPSVGETNNWSADTRKFYVMGEGGVDYAFGFDPSKMSISSLPGAKPGQPLIVGLRPEATFSFVDPDIIYGTTDANRFTISQYRFSTGKITPVFDTTKCGVQPPLDVTSLHERTDDDIGLSEDDSRISISVTMPPDDEHFVIVYDRKLGCRWYNTQTGQMGGQWGPRGYASAPGYSFLHARMTADGKYIRMVAYGKTTSFYLWSLDTLDVVTCPEHTSLDCGGYGTFGHSTYINSPGTIDEMSIVKRPADNLFAMTPLVWPLPTPSAWEQEKHFVWINGYQDDDKPVCATLYNYDDDISREWDNEIVCIETDGQASTVWRFAHHRAHFVDGYFNTQPLGNISKDGRFFLFTSTWDGQLGIDPDGSPHSDTWIVRLD